MNNVCGRGVSPKCVVFGVVFSMLRFVLGAPGSSTEEVSLREIIHKYNTSKDAKTLELEFSDCRILEPYFKKISGRMPKEDKELLKKYKRIVIRIYSLTIYENTFPTNGDVFKIIVEQIRPEELYIANGYLTDEDINGIRLNENIEVFKLNNFRARNMNNFFGEWNKSLVEVDISNSRLKSLPTGLENAASLRKLNIGYNWIFYKFGHNSDSKEKDKEIKRYESFNKITSLGIGGNLLYYTFGEGVSSFLELFPKVVDLDISDNNLKSMPAGLKNFTNLERLSIKNNPEIFKNWNSSEDSMNFKNITALDISRNRLGDIDEDKLCSFLKQFSDVINLKIWGNKLKNIPMPLEQLQGLERLDISGNPALFKDKSEKDISRFLSRFENVTDLSMSYAGLPRTVSIPLKNLKRLDISSNSELERIKHTEDNPEVFERLEELNVCNCGKLSIDNEFVEKLKNVKYLNIMGVLGKYDYGAICKLKKLRVLYIEKDVKIAHSQDYYLKLVKEDREKEELSREREELCKEAEELSREREELSRKRKEMNRRIGKLNGRIEELNRKRRRLDA